MLSTYTGTVPGLGGLARSIPGATGELRRDVRHHARTASSGTATLTGAFYAGQPSMTYTLTVDDYGTSKDITAP